MLWNKEIELFVYAITRGQGKGWSGRLRAQFAGKLREWSGCAGTELCAAKAG